MTDWAKETVEEMLEMLKGRGGFDGWWDSLDSDIQKEIFDELVQLQQKYIIVSDD